LSFISVLAFVSLWVLALYQIVLQNNNCKNCLSQRYASYRRMCSFEISHSFSLTNNQYKCLYRPFKPCPLKKFWCSKWMRSNGRDLPRKWAEVATLVFF